MPEYEALFSGKTGGGDKKIRDKKVSFLGKAPGIFSEIQVKLFLLRD